jgi:1,4-dihydroxy-2-naphthoate octaprenyltransferase
MLELTESHTRSTFIILSVNIVIIAIAFLLSGLRIYELFLILIGLAAIASAIPYYLVKRKRKRLSLRN